MNFTRAYAIFLRYFYLLRSSPQRIFSILVWATLDLVMWGFLAKYLTSIGYAGINFTSTFLGALILWSFLVRAQQGISTPVLEDTWSRNLLNYFASPLRVSEYVSGLLFTSIFTALLGFVIILVIALVFFGYSIFQLGVMLVPFLLVLFLFGVTLGLFAIGMILRYGPSAEWFVWPIPAVIQPFCGVLYPIAVLPAWMQGVGHLLPPMYVFEGMREALLEGKFSFSTFSIGMILTVLYLGVAYVFFVYVHRQAIRNGNISRFGAENS
jgi:ABC-2 type transport system permease protein